MRFLLDMNLPPRLAKLLSDREITATHWSFIGAPNANDKELMAFAQENDYVIVTCDLDFSAILSANHGKKPSVVQLRLLSFRAEQYIDLLANVLRQYNDELKIGAIITVDIKKARVRLLPL